ADQACLDLVHPDDLLALVVPALRTDAVAQLGLVAVRAEAQAGGLEVVVGAAAGRAGLGMTALGIRHERFSSNGARLPPAGWGRSPESDLVPATATRNPCRTASGGEPAARRLPASPPAGTGSSRRSGSFRTTDTGRGSPPGTAVAAARPA